MDPTGTIVGTIFMGTLSLLFSLLFFGIKKKPSDEKKEPFIWSVPIPPNLLARLRGFSPVAVSRATGMHLDDVFDILKGSKARTSPEVIELLQKAVKKLEDDDIRLEKEAAKISFMIRGLEAIEQKEKARLKLGSGEKKKEEK